jgi:hypothetical protein
MKKIIFVNLLIAVLFCQQIMAQQNVGIGITTPDNSALLDLTSTNKGILVPRMTTAQRVAIVTPATGLLVYDTSLQQFWYYNGTAWTALAGGGGGSCYTLQQSYDCGGAGVGRNIVISGTNSVNITDANAASIGLKSSHSADGVSIMTDNTYATGQYASIQASTASNYGVVGGTPLPTSAIIGNSTGKAFGVSGQVLSTATGEAGVFGNNLRTTGGHGVLGMGYNGTVGQTNNQAGFGVFGVNFGTATTGNAVGTVGQGYVGVWGETDDGPASGVFGQNVSASTVDNNVGVWGIGWVGVLGTTNDVATGYGVYSEGNLGSSGTKSFVIDHPLDPGNKILKHFSLESPEVLNLYRGNVLLDNNGEAVVTLPAYFDQININFSYQLTPIGAPAAGLYIKQEIKNGSFVIGGGIPNAKVSWSVYAERNDKFLQANPEAKKVEIMKKKPDTYLMPEIWGQPKSKGVFYGGLKTEQGKLLVPKTKLNQTELNLFNK